MMSFPVRTFAVALIISSAAAQSPFETYNQTHRLPAGCVDGYTAGTDTVLYTVPYTYSQVLSVIGSFKNLTWSGNPDNTVTLNGTDNTVGTARTYDTAGAHVIETLTLYQKPAAGPYEEAHTLAPLTIPSLNLSFYADYDANFATPVCNGAATLFNETINFCATNATAAAGVLHMIHLTDVTTVGKYLGGQNFTSCTALGNPTSATNSSSTGSGTSSNGTVAQPSGPAATPASFKGRASALAGNGVIAGLVAAAAMLV